MRGDLRTRLGFWVERFTFLHRWLFVFDGIAPSGFARAVNRVNGHVVLMSEDWKLITPGARTVPTDREIRAGDARS